jgi:hypothetical protein
MSTFSLGLKPPPDSLRTLARSLDEVVRALARCDANLKAAAALPNGLERAVLVAAGHADANEALRAIEAHCSRMTVSSDDARFFKMCTRMIDGLLREIEGPPE